MNVLEELEEAKAIYKGLQQMYSGEMVDGETVMEELKNNMDYKIYLTVGWNKNEHLFFYVWYNPTEVDTRNN